MVRLLHIDVASPPLQIAGVVDRVGLAQMAGVSSGRLSVVAFALV
jgi:hypothetical protein